MQTLDLDIENRVRVDFDVVVAQDVVRQSLLVLVLDVHELLLSLRIIDIELETGDFGEICDPAVADLVCNPGREERVAVKQETSLRDTICLVVEFLRHHLVEILQDVLLQDLRMKLRDAVDAVAADDGEVRHADLAVVNDRHVLDLVVVARILRLDLVQEAAVDLLDNLVNTRKQAGEEVDRPFLESLCHDCVVRVRAGACRDVPRLVPAIAVDVHEETHKLRDRDGRVCIVELESRMLRKGVECAVQLQLLLKSGLDRRGDEEVLLLQSELLACHVVIIRVQNFRDRAREVVLLDGLVVLSSVK